MNGEHYNDPTADKAIANYIKEQWQIEYRKWKEQQNEEGCTNQNSEGKATRLHSPRYT